MSQIDKKTLAHAQKEEASFKSHLVADLFNNEMKLKGGPLDPNGLSDVPKTDEIALLESLLGDSFYVMKENGKGEKFTVVFSQTQEELENNVLSCITYQVNSYFNTITTCVKNDPIDLKKELNLNLKGIYFIHSIMSEKKALKNIENDIFEVVKRNGLFLYKYLNEDMIAMMNSCLEYVELIEDNYIKSCIHIFEYMADIKKFQMKILRGNKIN